MTPEEFLARFDTWALEVKREAVTLFADGVPDDQALRIALQIVDAKVLGRARQQAALALPRRPVKID